MHSKTEKKFLSLGFSTDLINTISKKRLTVSGLTGLNEAALLEMGFTKEEADIIRGKVNRQPIPIENIENIIAKTGGVCCFCSDGNDTRPYQIHHIEEYHVNQNNEEDNLMLVCPTHHVAIHQNHKSRKEQISVRLIWENIWQIALAYKEKELSFPYQTFVSIDYSFEGSITEIFSFAEPTPSVCLKLLQPELLTDAKRIIEYQNKIIISGNSGSGKSTLAIGIAGSLPGFSTYLCSVGIDSSRTVNEIYTFLSMAVKHVILLIDDANTALTTYQIESILKLAEEKKKIIVVNTNNLDGSQKIELHFLENVFPVNWNLLQSGVKKTLINNGNEILQYLREKKLDYFNGSSVGHGIHEYNIKRIIESYSEEITSVWQLIFLLGSGIEVLDNIHVALVNNDRLDVVVLLISINQIARIEKGTTIDEIMDLYKSHSILRKGYVPERDWLKDQLDKLIEKRILKNQRGRYNTVHRYFARNFIEHSYFKSNTGTEEMLNGIFSDKKRIEEILILWSWLENSTLLKFIQEWYRAYDLNEWMSLVDTAWQASLSLLSLLAYRMYLIAPGGYVPIKVCFEGKGKDLATLINRGEENTLQSLKRLVTALKNNCNETLIEMFANVNSDGVAKLIAQSNPEYFGDINWLCNDIYHIDVNWLDTVCKKLSLDDLDNIVSKIKAGDIDTLSKVIEFHRTFVQNLKRSEFRKYVEKFGELLKGCGLEEIQHSASYSQPLFELPAFEKDITYILDCLNKDRLANDFSSASARHWGKLLTLSFYSVHSETKAIPEIIEKIDIPTLINNVQKYYQEYDYELRLLLYQLSFGSNEKRLLFSLALRPFIKEILDESDKDDVNDVFKAYCTLNYEEGRKLGEEMHKPIPEVTDINFPSFDSYKIQARELDESGEDFTLSETRFTVIPIDTKTDQTK